MNMETTKRADALARGLSTYFTGKPCKHGHISERFAKCGGCTQCSRERNRENNLKIASDPELRKANAAYHKAYRAANKDRLMRASRARYETSPTRAAKRRRTPTESQKAKRAAAQRAYHLANKDLLREKRRLRMSDDVARERAYANSREYGRALTRQKPIWHNEFDSFVWDEARNLASRRTTVTGFKWSVDHIVPLRSQVVSGLHWHANLRVVPFAFNTRKGNELAYQDPFSWIANM